MQHNVFPRLCTRVHWLSPMGSQSPCSGPHARTRSLGNSVVTTAAWRVGALRTLCVLPDLITQFHQICPPQPARITVHELASYAPRGATLT